MRVLKNTIQSSSPIGLFELVLELSAEEVKFSKSNPVILLRKTDLFEAVQKDGDNFRYIDVQSCHSITKAAAGTTATTGSIGIGGALDGNKQLVCATVNDPDMVDVPLKWLISGKTQVFSLGEGDLLFSLDDDDEDIGIMILSMIIKVTELP